MSWADFDFLEEPTKKKAPTNPIWCARPSDESQRISFVDLDHKGDPILEVMEDGAIFTRIVRWENKDETPPIEHWRINRSLCRQLLVLNEEHLLGYHDLLIKVGARNDRFRTRYYEVSACEDRWYTNVIIDPEERKFLWEPKKWPLQQILEETGEKSRPRHQWDWYTACGIKRVQGGEFEFGTLIQVWDAQGSVKKPPMNHDIPVPSTYLFAPVNPYGVRVDPHRWMNDHRTTRVTAEEMLHDGWRVD